MAVEFALGAEGILTVTARELARGKVTEAQFATLDTPESLRAKLQLPEPPTAPKGSRPLEAHAAAQDGGRRGLFGRLLGRKH